MSRFWYSLAWYLATPLVLVHLLWRARKQPEYLAHWGERWALRSAWPTGPGSERPLIWIHAVSVGETRAAQPLVAALERDYPDARLLLTAMTPTGRQTSEQLFGDRVMRGYLPYDYPGAMARFLEHWQPRVAIIMETELWPNLMQACHLRHLPVCLINARLSAKSLRKAQRWAGLIGPAVRQLSLIAVQSEVHAQRLRSLGAGDPRMTGNLKFDITPPPAMLELGRAWRGALNGRPVVLAASTREGEERLLLEQWHAHREQQRAAAPGLAGDASTSPLLVIVPRHPQRFDEIAQQIRELGFECRRRSDIETPSAFGVGLGAERETIVLGDSMGEMFAYYALADVAILGGSLLEHGGQNLIESCAVGTPVIMGPHTYNFEEAAQQAESHGAAQRVADVAEAVARSIDLAGDARSRDRMSAQARGFADEHRGATRKTMDAMRQWLPESKAKLTASSNQVLESGQSPA